MYEVSTRSYVAMAQHIFQHIETIGSNSRAWADANRDMGRKCAPAAGRMQLPKQRQKPE